MVSTQARPRQARPRIPVAEKYINMRTTRFTTAHERAMQEWLDTRGTEDGYWTEFKKRLAASEAKWRKDIEAIDRDPNMSFIETLKDEESFIGTYGDPREIDRGALEQLVRNLEDPDWQNCMRQGQMVGALPKTVWEQKFYDALVNPQDGSVPLMMDAVSLGAVRGASSHPAAPSITEVSVDPEIQKMAEEFAKNVCGFCKKSFGRLNKNHTDKCSKNPANAVATN